VLAIPLLRKFVPHPVLSPPSVTNDGFPLDFPNKILGEKEPALSFVVDLVFSFFFFKRIRAL